MPPWRPGQLTEEERAERKRIRQARADAERLSRTAEEILPRSFSKAWRPENAGTFGMIFVNSSRGLAMKVTIAGNADKRVTCRCQHEIQELIMYMILREIFQRINLSLIFDEVSFLNYYDAGSFASKDGKQRCFLLLDQLLPAPGQTNLVSVQYGVLNPLDTDVREMTGNPIFNSEGQEVSSGWLGVSPAAFAEIVGHKRSLDLTHSAGILVGYLESFRISLRDCEFIWAVTSLDPRPKLYIIDFDKILFDVSKSEIQRMRRMDGVFPKMSSSGEVKDPWARQFYRGYSVGERIQTSQTDRPDVLQLHRDLSQTYRWDVPCRGDVRDVSVSSAPFRWTRTPRERTDSDEAQTQISGRPTIAKNRRNRSVSPNGSGSALEDSQRSVGRRNSALPLLGS